MTDAQARTLITQEIGKDAAQIFRAHEADLPADDAARLTASIQKLADLVITHYLVYRAIPEMTEGGRQES